MRRFCNGNCLWNMSLSSVLWKELIIKTIHRPSHRQTFLNKMRQVWFDKSNKINYSEVTAILSLRVHQSVDKCQHVQNASAIPRPHKLNELPERHRRRTTFELPPDLRRCPTVSFLYSPLPSVKGLSIITKVSLNSILRYSVT